VAGLENYKQVFQKLENDKEAIKIFYEVAAF
jgi:hypothetical protein